MNVSFFHPETSCEFFPSHAEKKHNALIILIHGLMRTGRSMKSLGHFLNKSAYDVCIYRYPSAKFKIEVHSQHLEEFLRYLLSNEKEGRNFSIVTHSLGGILARNAICKLSSIEQARFQKLIMLAPPNKGSAYASRVLKLFPFLSSRIKPLSQLKHDPTSYIHKVPTPKGIKIGTIAGKLDAKSPPLTTHLEAQSDFMVIMASHTFIMNHPSARKGIIKFLQSDHF